MWRSDFEQMNKIGPIGLQMRCMDAHLSRLSRVLIPTHSHIFAHHLLCDYLRRDHREDAEPVSHLGDDGAVLFLVVAPWCAEKGLEIYALCSEDF